MHFLIRQMRYNKWIHRMFFHNKEMIWSWRTEGGLFWIWSLFGWEGEKKIVEKKLLKLYWRMIFITSGGILHLMNLKLLIWNLFIWFMSLSIYSSFLGFLHFSHSWKCCIFRFCYNITFDFPSTLTTTLS